MNEINQHKIKVYDFPECDDEEESKLLKSMKSRMPFAVVGSNYVFEISGDRKRGRKYPWGIVESKLHFSFHHLILIADFLQLKISNTVTFKRYEIF